MSDYKTILVHYDAGRTAPARLETAIKVAATFGSHVACLYALSTYTTPSYAIGAFVWIDTSPSSRPPKRPAEIGARRRTEPRHETGAVMPSTARPPMRPDASVSTPSPKGA